MKDTHNARSQLDIPRRSSDIRNIEHLPRLFSRLWWTVNLISLFFYSQNLVSPCLAIKEIFKLHCRTRTRSEHGSDSALKWCWHSLSSSLTSCRPTRIARSLAMRRWWLELHIRPAISSRWVGIFYKAEEYCDPLLCTLEEARERLRVAAKNKGILLKSTQDTGIKKRDEKSSKRDVLKKKGWLEIERFLLSFTVFLFVFWSTAAFLPFVAELSILLRLLLRLLLTFNISLFPLIF